jgi:antitoxin component of MazEF toxin-antitoxin module
MSDLVLRTWGGSVALPIPRPYLNQLGLSAGSAVSLRLQGNALMIEAAKPKYTLAELMREQAALNLPHDEAWLNDADLPSERI